VNKELYVNILLFFAGLSLFIQITALVSLVAMAAYVFGLAAIAFAILALVVDRSD